MRAWWIVGLVFGLASIGCSSGDGDSTRPGDRAGGVGGERVDDREALASNGRGTVRGTVTLDGEAPPQGPINVTEHPHAGHCQVAEETWVVDAATRGVANVVVWLRPPSGRAFARDPDAERTWPERVVIDQPDCMFRPRVSVVYPEYFDSAKRVTLPTGQRLVIRNSAEIPHQATVKGSNTRNPERGTTLSPKPPGGTAPELVLKLVPDRVPVTITCQLHRWMRGYVWAFDHPYATVTDAEGRYEIPNAPAGAEVYLMAWHEAGKVAMPRDGEAITVPDGGEVRLDVTLTLP